MDNDLDDLDAATVLAATQQAVRVRRRVEVTELKALAAWAALHSADPTQGPDRARARKVGNVLVQLGGDGTPKVQDHCLGEIALARGTGVVATTHALADVLDLLHRLPKTWEVCRTGAAEVWIARKVAKLSRHLPAAVIDTVDTAVARCLGHEAAGRVLAVAEAKIIEADPDLHERRVAAERQRRHVSLGRTDQYGLRLLVARLEAGDAVWIQATVSRVAKIIGPDHPDTGADELRAIALGYLARPAELFTLLVQAEAAAEQTVPDQPQPEPEADPPAPEAEPDAESDCHPGPSRATAFPADLLDALSKVDFTPLAPKATLYTHLHQAALEGHPAVARVEGLGPVAVSSLKRLLCRTRLTIRPVLDLSARVRTTAYEHPEALKERIYLVTGGDYWPYAVSTSRDVDYDHPIPYDDTGPPGQTGTHNSGPLGRRHHRWKTHAGYQTRQTGPGRYVWLTPHGQGYVVDNRGTRQIDPDTARYILNAPPGINLHPDPP